MIDVFMTPQSEEDDLSDDSSPRDAKSKTDSEQTSPPVSTFLEAMDSMNEPDSTNTKQEESQLEETEPEIAEFSGS